jgi:hypothetical protein
MGDGQYIGDVDNQVTLEPPWPFDTAPRWRNDCQSTQTARHFSRILSNSDWKSSFLPHFDSKSMLYFYVELPIEQVKGDKRP